MSEKNLFQVLLEMNLNDIEEGTEFVRVGGCVISAKKVGLGTEVTMGADSSVALDLMNNKSFALLLIVDKDEFKRRDQ